MALIEWISAGLVLILLVANIGLYFWAQRTYFKYRIFMRKLYYSVILITGFIAYAMVDFPVSTLVELGALVTLVVFIDLAIFQTPDITKFMTHEFKHEEIEQTFHKHEDMVALQGIKLMVINGIIRRVKEDWVADDIDMTHDEYEEFVRRYLEDFTDAFEMGLLTYYVPSSNDASEFKRNLDETYTKIRDKFSFDIRAVGMRKRQVINRLENGNSIIIIEKDTSYAIVPFSPRNHSYNFIFVIHTKKDNGDTLNETDAALVTNMLYMLEMWMDCQEATDYAESYDGEGRGEQENPENLETQSETVQPD